MKRHAWLIGIVLGLSAGAGLAASPTVRPRADGEGIMGPSTCRWGEVNALTGRFSSVTLGAVTPAAGSYYGATNEGGVIKWAAFAPGTGGGGGGGSATTWKYWTNLVSVTGASANYLYPLSTNACEIPHIYTWANNTNACDFSGTVWLWGQNTYLPDENVNRFAVRYQVTRFTNVVAANGTQLVVLDASSFNNDDIITIHADVATGTNNPTEWAVVTNRSSNTLMLRSGVTNNYTSTSGYVHRVVRFDGLDWYYNAVSNALPMTMDFTVAITNNIAVKVMEVDN